MSKKPYVAPPVRLYGETIRVNQYLLWAVFRVPSLLLLYMFFRRVVISTDTRSLSPALLVYGVAFLLWGIGLPRLIEYYRLHIDIYNDGIYMKIKWWKEQTMGMKFKHLVFCTPVTNYRQFMRAGKKSRTKGKLRVLLTTGFRGVLLVTNEGDQYMVPSRNPIDMDQHISNKT